MFQWKVLLCKRRKSEDYFYFHIVSTYCTLISVLQFGVYSELQKKNKLNKTFVTRDISTDKSSFYDSVAREYWFFHLQQICMWIKNCRQWEKDPCENYTVQTFCQIKSTATFCFSIIYLRHFYLYAHRSNVFLEKFIFLNCTFLP